MASTKIESDHVTVNASQATVFTYLSDFNNYKNLLPQDKISDWKATVDDCSFKIQNAAVIPLVKKSVEPSNIINIVSGEKTPFPFTLVVHIDPISESDNDNCEVFLKFDGDINAFLKMMVMKPLTNLFNYMAKKVQDVHA